MSLRLVLPLHLSGLWLSTRPPCPLVRPGTPGSRDHGAPSKLGSGSAAPMRVTETQTDDPRLSGGAPRGPELLGDAWGHPASWKAAHRHHQDSLGSGAGGHILLVPSMPRRCPHTSPRNAPPFAPAGCLPRVHLARPHRCLPCSTASLPPAPPGCVSPCAKNSASQDTSEPSWAARNIATLWRGYCASEQPSKLTLQKVSPSPGE